MAENNNNNTTDIDAYYANLKTYVGKPVRISSRADNKCLACFRKRHHLEGNLAALIKINTELMSEFTQEKLDFYQTNFKCTECKMLTIEIDLIEPFN